MPKSLKGSGGFGDLPASKAPKGSLSLDGLPASKAPKGNLTLDDLPASKAPKGNLSLDGLPASKAPKGNLTLDGLPASKAPKGNLTLDDLPASKAPKGSLSLDGLPASKAPKGNLTLDGLPTSKAPKGNLTLDDLPASKIPKGGLSLDGLPASKAPKGNLTLDDLPASKVSKGSGGGFSDMPAQKASGGFGDLPALDVSGGFGDLPALDASGGFGKLGGWEEGGGFGDLSTPNAEGGGFGDFSGSRPGVGEAVAPSGAFGEGFGDPFATKGVVDFSDLFGAKDGASKLTGFEDFSAPPVGGGLPTTKGVGGGGFGEIDLPTVPNDLPANTGLNAHLPSPALSSAHLPMVLGLDLPSPMSSGAHLPSPMSSGAHLPSPMSSGAHLPSPMSPGAHLPSPMSSGAHLPSPMGFDAHLPSATSPGAHLPSPMGFDAHLPSATSPGAHLPSSPGFDAHLPSAMAPNAHMPVPVSDDRLLPNRHGGPSPISFGELDLPLVGNSADPPPFPPRLDGSLGEVDLPADSGGGRSSPASMAHSAGGMAFGEVDLGVGVEMSDPIGPPPAATGGTLAFQEASLEEAAVPRVSAAPGRTRAQAVDRPPSKIPKILGVAAAVIVVGGAALQFTTLGAFGYLWIGDKLHSRDNVATAASMVDATRKKLAVDTFPVAQAAADELVEARKRSPRSRPLAAYAAFVEFENQVRFGTDPARAARVSTFITEVPPNTEVLYLAAAQAAQSAQAGDWEKAKRAVDAAIAKEPKDAIQHELMILKGEIALAQKDSASALSAFTSAQASGGSARAYFGLARAHYMVKALGKAKEAVDAALKVSPTHAGALTLRAEMVGETHHDDEAALKDLGAVLDEKSRKNLGSAELSHALAAKGWLMLSRERAGEARAAFDEAVKIDPRNVSALVGQGEVLYADGRYTEAHTRFEEAVSKDPTSSAAVIGSAKTKIALERLQDAKAQLLKARQAAPKDMNVALWLARTEEALGNKKAAEDLYGTTVDLADPKNPEAIEAYAAFARFLASQGKSAEAAAKLEQARAKLPDSAALQRAFGDVNVAEGQFEEALSHFEAALQLNANDLGARFRLGVTYRRMHKLELAAKALDEVAAIDKEYPGIALERGLLFEESGDIQKALEQFQSASQKAPNDIDLMLRVGAAYVAIGEIDKALPLLLKVKDQRPNSAEANHFVGRAYLKQGGLEAAAAMRYLQRAVSLDPNKAEYHLYVAWAANEAIPAQLGLARTHIDKALQLDRLLADGYWQRGVLLRKEGQINDAIKDLTRALTLKPSRYEAHAALAEAYEDKNEIGAAMVEWQKAIAGDEKHPLWRWRYGKQLADKNQNAEAMKHLVYAVEQGKVLQPRPGWLGQAAFEAGEVLRKMGQKKEACEDYALFLELAAPTSPDRRDALKAQNDLGCVDENSRLR